MAEMQSGVAVVWGAGGLAFTYGIISATHGSKMQSLSITRDSEKTYVKDLYGQTVGRVDTDLKATMTITVTPCHANTRAGANASFYAHLIAPGSLVWMTDANGVFTIIESAGWRVNQSRGLKTNRGAAVVELDLERFDDHALLRTLV